MRARRHIEEDILQTRCPRPGCRQAFFDFDGCFAVKCCRCGGCSACVCLCTRMCAFYIIWVDCCSVKQKFASCLGWGKNGISGIVFREFCNCFVLVALLSDARAHFVLGVGQTVAMIPTRMWLCVPKSLLVLTRLVKQSTVFSLSLYVSDS